jgi:hypothetical protein
MYVSWTSIEAGREFQTRVGIHIDARHHLIPFELLIIVALILPTSELRASPEEQIYTCTFRKRILSPFTRRIDMFVIIRE